jgi:hypothetical protein
MGEKSSKISRGNEGDGGGACGSVWEGRDGWGGGQAGRDRVHKPLASLVRTPPFKFLFKKCPSTGQPVRLKGDMEGLLKGTTQVYLCSKCSDITNYILEHCERQNILLIREITKYHTH